MAETDDGQGRARTATFVDLAEGIATLVNDGDTVALEGFTHLIPVAAGQEIIRQRRRDLELVRMTPDIVYDQMVGAGCARKLVFSWGGNPGVGSLHRLRDAIEHDWPAPLELDEPSVAVSASARTYLVLKTLSPLFSIAPMLKSPTAAIMYWSRSSSRPKTSSSHFIAFFSACIAKSAWSSLPGST